MRLDATIVNAAVATMAVGAGAIVAAIASLGRQSKGAVPPCTLDPTTNYAIITGEASRRAAAGRAQPLAKFGRRGMGRFPRKCKLRGPCG